MFSSLRNTEDAASQSPRHTLRNANKNEIVNVYKKPSLLVHRQNVDWLKQFVEVLIICSLVSCYTSHPALCVLFF